DWNPITQPHGASGSRRRLQVFISSAAHVITTSGCRGWQSLSPTVRMGVSCSFNAEGGFAMSQHIFISHTTKDDATVAVLRRALESLGLSVWADSRELTGGDELAPKI